MLPSRSPGRTKTLTRAAFRILAVAVLGALPWTVGCHSEKTEAPATEAKAAAEAATEQAANESAPGASEESTTETMVMSRMNVQETLKESDRAVQSKEWTKATDALLKLQLSGSMQTDQDSWGYNQRMTQLQGQLSEAAGNGDAKAQAAIDLLRKSRRVR